MINRRLLMSFHLKMCIAKILGLLHYGFLYDKNGRERIITHVHFLMDNLKDSSIFDDVLFKGVIGIGAESGICLLVLVDLLFQTS